MESRLGYFSDLCCANYACASTHNQKKNLTIIEIKSSLLVSFTLIFNLTVDYSDQPVETHNNLGPL